MHRVWPLLFLLGCDDTVFVVPPGPVSYDPDWEGVQALIDDKCAVCHATGNPVTLPADLEADVISGAGALVVAGDPDASLLWRVVADERIEGDFGAMPLGAALPRITVDHVKAWIEAGAPLSDTPTDTDTDTP